MTRKRVGGIQKFAVLLALGAFVPGLAAAQEFPSTSSFGCWDPYSAAQFVCEDLYSELTGDESDCRAYCRKVRQTCHRHVVAVTRCLDRLNKDVLKTWNAWCRGEYPEDPEGRRQCRMENRDFAAELKSELLDAQATAKEFCQFCDEVCFDFCSLAPPS